jgi:hypothetical protein
MFNIINEFVPALINLSVSVLELGLVTAIGIGVFVAIGKVGSVIGSIMAKAKSALE